VYWGTPANDGYGGATFDSPVEILCRWEDRIGQFTARGGEQMYTKATVYVLQDLVDGGWLFLGELTDLPSDTSQPKEIDDAYEIKRFDKLPTLGSTTEFIRKAYL
jgi:hypothetical protein